MDPSHTVLCPALQNLTNGFVSCGEDADMRFSYKNSCSFSCDQGYHLVGASRVTCTSGGTWNQQIPHCEAILCQNPEREAPLIMQCSESVTELRPNSTCSFSCEEGFELQGANTIKCSEDGQWNKNTPTCTCEPILPGLLPPENGHISCSSTESVYNSQCSFTCDQGYSLEGPELLTCGHHGNWTAEKPTCQGKEETTDKRGKETFTPLQILVQMFTLFIFHNVSTAPAPVAAITAGVAAGATALFSGVSMNKSVMCELSRFGFTSFQNCFLSLLNLVAHILLSFITATLTQRLLYRATKRSDSLM
uniref:Sushi domain-containing protein n=1 Tax=Neolamprologus brichardi TaxID=32507 RepID=A0A3Q4FXA6_NEOBR